MNTNKQTLFSLTIFLSLSFISLIAFECVSYYILVIRGENFYLPLQLETDYFIPSELEGLSRLPTRGSNSLRRFFPFNQTPAQYNH